MPVAVCRMFGPRQRRHACQRAGTCYCEQLHNVCAQTCRTTAERTNSTTIEHMLSHHITRMLGARDLDVCVRDWWVGWECAPLSSMISIRASALWCQRIQLIKEHHAGLGTARSEEQRPNRALTLAHELVQQLRAFDRNEISAAVCSSRLGHQRFAAPWGTEQQKTSGHRHPQRLEALWMPDRH